MRSVPVSAWRYEDNENQHPLFLNTLCGKKKHSMNKIYFWIVKNLPESEIVWYLNMKHQVMKISIRCLNILWRNKAKKILNMSSEISQNYGKENYVENLSTSVLPCFIWCLKVVPMALPEKRMVAGLRRCLKRVRTQVADVLWYRLLGMVSR